MKQTPEEVLKETGLTEADLPDLVAGAKLSVENNKPDPMEFILGISVDEPAQ